MINKIFSLSLLTTLCILTLIGLGIIFFFSSVVDSNESEKKNTSYTYLALGDSYTIGESVEENNSWPIVLSKALTVEGLAIESTKIIAQTGWRTDNLMTVAKAEKLDNYDLVSLLIGVNNEFQGENPAGFKAKFTECLQFAIAQCSNGKAGVFVLSIPDYGYTAYGKRNQAKISQRIDEYNAICKAVSEDHGVKYFDITPISRKGLKQKDLVAYDGLHPSAKQYQLWVDMIKTDVGKIILP